MLDADGVSCAEGGVVSHPCCLHPSSALPWSWAGLQQRFRVGWEGGHIYIKKKKKWPAQNWPHTFSASLRFYFNHFFHPSFYSCWLLLPFPARSLLRHAHPNTQTAKAVVAIAQPAVWSLKQLGQSCFINKRPKWGSMHKTWSAACCRNELLLHNCISEP